jgi:hypothetical protein
LLLTLACSLFEIQLSAPTTPVAEIPKPSATEEQDTGTQVDAWIETVDTLRSVNVELATLFANRESQTLAGQIDSQGNIHLTLAKIQPRLPTPMPVEAFPKDFELFIVDKQAYTRMSYEDPLTLDNSYLTLLADTLFSPEGPGLWLSIVPEAGYTLAGKESFGGFNTTMYMVNGKLEKGTVNGKIWVADQQKALVRAELVIAEGLFYPPGSRAGGDVRINLKIQQANIPKIQLP